MNKLVKVLFSSLIFFSLASCGSNPVPSSSSSASSSSITSSSSTSSESSSEESSSVESSESTTAESSTSQEPVETYYHVTFVNYDDSVLYEVDVLEGGEAHYSGETPTKPEDDEFTYEFDGWDEQLTSIESDLTTKAVFKTKSKINWGEIHWF